MISTTLLLAALCAAPLDNMDDLHGCLARTGDLDGDGMAELLVASRLLGARNLVWVVSGRTGVPLRTLSQPEAIFGCALADAGDVDGDGYADALVGARGVALVLSGADGELLHRLSSPAPVRGDDFASSFDGGEDLDGDGHADLIVGAPAQGACFVYSGRTGELAYALQNTEKGLVRSTPAQLAALGRLPLAASRALRFGEPARLAPDADGDGKAELLVASTKAVHLLDGESGEALASYALPDLPGQCADERRLPWTLGWIEDVDGDERYDLWATQITGWLAVWSGGTKERLQLTDWNGYYCFGDGSSADAAGDLDGDGVPELLVGANEGPILDSDPGWAIALRGSDLRGVRSWNGSDGVPPRADPEFSDTFDVCCLGDVDRDGVDDIALYHRPSSNGSGTAPTPFTSSWVHVVSGASNELLWGLDLVELYRGGGPAAGGEEPQDEDG